MKVWRVYKNWYELAESGTYEYGYFSSLALAKEKVRSIIESKIKTRHKPLEVQYEKNGGAIISWGVADHEHIYCSEIEVHTGQSN